MTRIQCPFALLSRTPWWSLQSCRGRSLTVVSMLLKSFGKSRLPDIVY